MSFIKKMVKGAKNVLDGDSFDKGNRELNLKINLLSDSKPKTITNTVYGLGVWRYS